MDHPEAPALGPFTRWHHQQQKQQKQEPNTALGIASLKDERHRNLTENPKALGSVRHPQAHPTAPNKCTQSGGTQEGDRILPSRFLVS